jgi:hypothetical protein
MGKNAEAWIGKNCKFAKMEKEAFLARIGGWLADLGTFALKKFAELVLGFVAKLGANASKETREAAAASEQLLLKGELDPSDVRELRSNLTVMTYGLPKENLQTLMAQAEEMQAAASPA